MTADLNCNNKNSWIVFFISMGQVGREGRGEEFYGGVAHTIQWNNKIF